MPSQSTEDTTIDDVTFSRRGLGKRLLLGASALAILIAAGKRDEVQAAPVTDPWRLGGNSISTDGTNYLGTTNSAPLIFKTAGVERMRILANGNIAIGNTNSNARLLVDAPNGYAVFARHTSAQGAPAAVRGETNATVANATGVQGVVMSTAPGADSAGMRGDNKGTNGNGSGVRGTHAGSGIGVHATAGANGFGMYASGGYAGAYGTGSSYGVVGISSLAGSTGVYGSGGETGVYGMSATYGVRGEGNTYGLHGSGATGVYGTSTTGTGVFGTSSASNAVFGKTTHNDSAGVFGDGTKYGIFGKATATSGQSYGVYGTATTGWAGFFQGDVNVTNNISKAGGSFKIDHPLDPENKYLYHSFVESPDMMNVYNGNVVTDAKGDATVTLPAYFEALNHDFRYQLTPIGQLAQAAVINEISSNAFTVKTDKPNVKLSWQVTGIRKDAYANAHRIPNEVQKPTSERGRYLHPEAFGKPATMGVAAIHAPQVMPDVPPQLVPSGNVPSE